MTRRTALLLAATALRAQEPGGQSVYKDRPAQPPRSPDSGERATDPATEKDIAIGYFGPPDPAHPLGGSVWTGVSEAIVRANRTGGYRGKPYRLAAAWSESPWKGGVSQLAKLTYSEHTWAIIAGIDGTTAHLAEQVSAKALLAVVDPASTDKTVNGAAVPWIFSCAPTDVEIAAALVPEIRRVAGSAFVILTGTDHDSRMTTAELKAKAAPLRILEYTTSIPAIPDEAKAVAIVAGPLESVKLLEAVRRQKPALPVFGGPMMARSSFRKAAGDSARGVVVPKLSAQSSEFGEWDYAALAGFDAANLIVAAIHTAGLNRSAIRDAIEDLSPYKGVSGEIRWQADGRNVRPVSLESH